MEVLVEFVEVAGMGVRVELSQVVKSVPFSWIAGNCVIQATICEEMSGSFHQGLTVQTGADLVEFRVTVVMVFVPEH